MSKGASKEKAKALRKEKAIKKARRKTIILVSIFALVVITVAVVGIFARRQSNSEVTAQIKETSIESTATESTSTESTSTESTSTESTSTQAEVFSLGRQTVHLLADGTFSASLAHGVRKSGSYTKTEESDGTIVSFNVNGKEEVGWITNNALHLPHEWDDNHGHGNVFPRNR